MPLKKNLFWRLLLWDTTSSLLMSKMVYLDLMNFQYYIEVVPTVVDALIGKKTTYQYSVKVTRKLKDDCGLRVHYCYLILIKNNTNLKWLVTQIFFVVGYQTFIPVSGYPEIDFFCRIVDIYTKRFSYATCTLRPPISLVIHV